MSHGRISAEHEIVHEMLREAKQPIGADVWPVSLVKGVKAVYKDSYDTAAKQSFSGRGKWDKGKST